MSLLTTAYLMERYGVLLDEDQLGEVLHISGATVRNQRALGVLEIPAAKTHGRKVLFHAQDVATHIDAARSTVRQPTARPSLRQAMGAM